MSQNFMNALQYETNFTTTENGAIALKSTNSALVDLFGTIGSLRSRTESDIEHSFTKAFAEDKLLAMKMLFYARNIRDVGCGERRTARIIYKFLAKLYPEVMRKNIHNIPFFGRYDDLYEFIGTSVENDMWDFIKQQWTKDILNMNEGESVSLLSKWLKSCNASSKQSITLGRLTAKKLGLSETKYRKQLSALRKHIDVVEVKMCANEWTNINYSGVPSKAMSNYRNAFKTHDADGFAEFIGKVEKGETTIKASTLYPYELLEKSCGGSFRISSVRHDPVLEAQWKALPNYIEGENNVLVMADTSGSMYGRPMATSVGLAIYFGERNHGVFKDTFLTFSSQPSLVKLTGNTLFEKMRCVPEIVSDTNLEAAFRLVLNTAINNKLTQDDMPKAIVVISDMEMNSCVTNANRYNTWFQSIEQMYAQHGYSVPTICFWNVNSRSDKFQVTCDKKGVQLASGQSVSIFKAVLANFGYNPYDAMVKTLSSPIFDSVVI